MTTLVANNHHPIVTDDTNIQTASDAAAIAANSHDAHIVVFSMIDKESLQYATKTVL